MAITSEEIHNQSFTVDRKGYDVDEVDVFLEHVAAEIDGLNAEIDELTARIHELENGISYDDDEPMDMDAAFAEPALPVQVDDEPAEQEAAPRPMTRKMRASPSSSVSFPRRKTTPLPSPTRS